jgi:hypothetical protein
MSIRTPYNGPCDKSRQQYLRAAAPRVSHPGRNGYISRARDASVGPRDKDYGRIMSIRTLYNGPCYNDNDKLLIDTYVLQHQE